MIFWMSIAAGIVITLDSLFEIPDEVEWSGIFYKHWNCSIWNIELL